MAGDFTSASVVILAGGGKAAVAVFFCITGCFLLPINGSWTDVRFAGAICVPVIDMTVNFPDYVRQSHNAALSVTAILTLGNTRQAANTSLDGRVASFSSVSMIANATSSACNVAVLSYPTR